MIELLSAGGWDAVTFGEAERRSGVSRDSVLPALPCRGRADRLHQAAFPLPEIVTIPRHVRVRHVEGLAEAALSARLSPVDPSIIAGLPEGPDEQARATQRFTYVIDAVALDGRRARGVMEGTDTYGTTATIAVESARRLVADQPKPGVLAPAQAYDPASFLDFLLLHDMRWTLEEGTEVTEPR